MLASDLLLSSVADLPPSPENPLQEPGFLQECQMLGVRLDALRSTAGLLFELRTAMHLSLGAAAIIIARDVDKLGWCADQAAERRTAWAVIGGECRLSEDLIELEAYISPNASLLVRARCFEFYNLDVIGLGEEVSDYVEDGESAVRANTANWESCIMPLAASFRYCDKNAL